MSKLRFSIAVSLDGYAAGPAQSEENPLGIDGERLHEWATPLEVFKEMHGRGSEGGEVNASDDVLRESFANVGASIMGRACSGRSRDRGARIHGEAGGETNRPSTTRSSSSHTTSESHWS